MTSVDTSEIITSALAAPKVEDGIEQLADRQVLIYGAGNYGRIIHRLLTENGFPQQGIAGFLDAAPDGRKIAGYTVRNPKDPAISENLRQHAVVVISIYSSIEEHDRIAEKLHRLGYRNVRSCYDIAISFYTANDPKTRLAGSDYFHQNYQNIVDGSTVWDDQVSRETYVRHFSGYARCDIRQFNHEASHRQYFLPQLFRKDRPVRFIDCGAFDGDTVRELFAQIGQVEALALFEPCDKNLKELQRFIRMNRNDLSDEIILFPCGVWDTTTQLCFDNGAAAASAVSTAGESCIQCVALDDALHGFRPTLIKMDVEGAEPAALRGAESMIREYKPDLAISVYHSLSHFWEIPKIVRQWVPEYRLFLRTYAAAGFETVMYATVADSRNGVNQ